MVATPSGHEDLSQQQGATLRATLMSEYKHDGCACQALGIYMIKFYLLNDCQSCSHITITSLHTVFNAAILERVLLYNSPKDILLI